MSEEVASVPGERVIVVEEVIMQDKKLLEIVSSGCIRKPGFLAFHKVSNNVAEDPEFVKAFEKSNSWTQESLEENIQGLILEPKF